MANRSLHHLNYCLALARQESAKVHILECLKVCTKKIPTHKSINAILSMSEKCILEASSMRMNSNLHQVTRYCKHSII